MKRSVIGLVVMLAMLAAVITPVALAQPVVQTSTSLTKIFFEPDAGSGPFLNIINSAKADLKIEVYIMTSHEIFGAIGDAVNRGVKVQVILTRHPYEMESVAQSAYSKLTSLGARSSGHQHGSPMTTQNSSSPTMPGRCSERQITLMVGPPRVSRLT